VLPPGQTIVSQRRSRVLLIVQQSERARAIVDALRCVAEIAWVRSDQDLAVTLERECPDLVVWYVEPNSPTIDHLVSVTRVIRTITPCRPIILYCPIVPQLSRVLLIAGRIGIDRLCLQGCDDLVSAVEDSLHEHCYVGACSEILDAIGPLPSNVALIVAQCVRQAFQSRLTVDRLARVLKLDRKTVYNRLHSSHCPSTARLISWSRVLAAGWLLDRQEPTVTGAARTLHFASPSEMRGMLRRYTRLTATELRRRGALRSVVASFRLACGLSGEPAARAMLLPQCEGDEVGPQPDLATPPAVTGIPRRESRRAIG
jgi:AraC-like DNA-binding protein